MLSPENPHLAFALQRLSLSFDTAVGITIEATGQLSGSALKSSRRDELLLTQGLLRQQRAGLLNQLERALRREWSRQDERGPAAKPTGWGELTLMDDSAVDALVVADRIGKALAHGCEWELRDMEAYTGALVGDPQAGPDQNPLRPELIARALLACVDALTDQHGLRQTLSEELTRALAPQMRAFYGDLAEHLDAQGLPAQALRALSPEAGVRPPREGRAAEGAATPGGEATPGGGRPGSASGAGRAPIGGAMIGQVAPAMMSLLRQLTVSSAPTDVPTLVDESQAGLAPGNLITMHREQLRQVTQTPLDHMVIDVVASLFDAILADPKVPPQMARLLGRLQLPVLRAALGDNTFFSKRNHPVRRFINRLATLACAYDDFSRDPGLDFLRRVAELVEEIASGDFEKIKLYEQQLDALEQVVSSQQQAAVEAAARDAAALLARKETQARQQQQYQEQLERALADLPLPGFLRQFLIRDWAPVIVLTTLNEGEAKGLEMRRLGKELAASVLPKAGSPARKDFLSLLPQLVRGVNQGLDAIGSPDAVRKQLFTELMPVHAESLKTPALSPLDHNLLVKRIEAAFGLALPDEVAAARVQLQVDIDLEQVFAPTEARNLGLVAESAVAWNGQVDILLGEDVEEPPLQAADISIAGLPDAEAPTPTRGAALFDHLELGSAYWLNTENTWRKVRLSHISAQRSFFIFTEGKEQLKTVTMTARMLRRLCESKRLRAVESAHLLERATARARRQLAALSA